VPKARHFPDPIEEHVVPLAGVTLNASSSKELIPV
jgi:hypothetical protein